MQLYIIAIVAQGLVTCSLDLELNVKRKSQMTIKRYMYHDVYGKTLTGSTRNCKNMPLIYLNDVEAIFITRIYKIFRKLILYENM